MISSIEREQVLQQIAPIAEKLVDSLEKRDLVLQIVQQYLLNVGQSASEMEDLKDETHVIYKLWEHIIASVTAEKTLQLKVYTTGQLAQFFGVSITTINNWIEQGRIKGIFKAGRNKQARIPEHAVWVTSLGEEFHIFEIVEMYEQELAKTGRDKPFTEEDERQDLLGIISYYEEKFGGAYEETLGQQLQLTAEEQRIADEWRYLLKRVSK